MTATRIQVRVNPADPDEYVIYADPADTDGQHWLLLRPDGQYDRWEYDGYVVDWTEFELTIPIPVAVGEFTRAVAFLELVTEAGDAYLQARCGHGVDRLLD